MAQEQPSLEAKRAFFTHFKTLPHSDDEDDVGSGSAEGQSDDDGLDPREQRERQRHRRFFRNGSPRQTAHDAPSLEYNENQSEGTLDTVHATPEDDAVVVTSSARATPASKKRSKASSKRHRNIVDDLLDNDGDDDVEIIGETPIDTTNRQRASAKIATPIPLAKRIPPKLASSSSSLLRVGATLAGAASTTRKRKIDGQVTLRPEGEQIFKGLLFYYIPDNEIAPARRLRIQKAHEYGAVRTSDATEATHVIVDRDIVYRDAERAMATRRGERGVEGVVLVNEDYPIECVQFKALLDWKQKRYRLAGQPEDGVTQNETVEVEREDEEEVPHMSLKEKLQLKEPQQNPKKWDYAPKSTPPNASDESPGIDSQPIVLDAATTSEGGHVDAAPRAESAQRGISAPGDELTKMIDMMQEFKDLPLDHDDEDETASTTAPDSGSDDEPESQRKAPTTRKASAGAGTLGERFACARSGALDAHAANPNARTVEVLQSMLAYYERTSDQWRVLAYRKAISTLKRQRVRVDSAQDALRLPGVGPRLAAKIEEIATTDRLRRLEYAEQEGSDAVLKLFLGIYGVGPALAAQWAARGMRTLQDVQSQVRLTPAQTMGIERYKDLNTKIPRDEVEALADVVREAAAQVDADVELIVGGSYRRGAPASSDVDFIVTKPNTTSEAQLVPFLRELVGRLQESQFLVATLAADGNIWQGCCVLPQPPGSSGVLSWRRLDFLLVPATQMGAALIYFTGDDVFNRSLRLLARKRGMKLNQRGLYRRVGGGDGGGRQGGRTTEEDLVEGGSERRIFEILGVSWREPTERWC